MARDAEINTPCPVPGCRGPRLKPWKCCQCGFAPNDLGWCQGDVREDGEPKQVWCASMDQGRGGWMLVTTCDHGNCPKCTIIGTDPHPPANTVMLPAGEARRG